MYVHSRIAYPALPAAMRPACAGWGTGLVGDRADEQEQPQRYPELERRAEAFLRDRGGSAPEDLLIAHVYGSGFRPAMWRDTFRSQMAPCPTMHLRADGCWSLPGFAGVTAGDLLQEFVALDVETTGLQPSRQRIVEVAAIRFHDGVETERFETLINPGKRLPKYISQLTRIDDSMLADAPPFAEIAARLLELLEGALIVGHNVPFDIGFVNAELGRLGIPGLVNERLDTMGLATRLMPGIRRPSLERVADTLGVLGRNQKIHRAGMDASITGQVALRLAAHAKEAGYTSIDQLKGLGGSLPAKPSERHSSARTVLDRGMLDAIPRRPGVYIMRNINNEIVYVGKSKNMRERVGSYFSQRIGVSRKMDGLIESLKAIETVVVGSELEALLLESQLIRRYQPRYNSAIRGHEWYPFIRVDISNPWPRITLARTRKADDAVYFGPFRQSSSARKTVDLLNRVVPLRTCSRSFKSASSYGNPCIELSLNRCLGPCVGKADRDEYLQLVRNVVEFLNGRDETLYEMLWAGLEDSARRLDFEKAERIRRELRNVTSVVASQRRIRELVERSTCLVVLPSSATGARELLLISGGRPWSRTNATAEESPDAVASRLAGSWDRLRARGVWPIDHDSVDDAFVIRRWLVLASGSETVIPVTDHPDWKEIARQVMAIPADALPADFAALGGSPDAEPEGTTDPLPAVLRGAGDGDEAAVYSPDDELARTLGQW